MSEGQAHACLGGLGRGGLSGIMEQGRRGNRCVLEGGAGQAELSKCKGVESSFSGQIGPDLMHLVGRVGPDGPARCVWTR